MENWRKHNSGKQPTVDCTLERTQPTFQCQTQRMWNDLCRTLVCRTPVEAGGSSLNRQWLEFELTLYNILAEQLYVVGTTTRNSDQYNAWPPNPLGAQEAEEWLCFLSDVCLQITVPKHLIEYSNVIRTIKPIFGNCYCLNDQFISSNNNIYAELLLPSKQFSDRLFQDINEFCKTLWFLIMMICRGFFLP